MEQQIIEVLGMSDNAIIATLAGGMIATVGGVFKFVFSRLDKKVSKDVFEQFEEKNQLSHDITHQTLMEIKDKIK